MRAACQRCRLPVVENYGNTLTHDYLEAPAGGTLALDIKAPAPGKKRGTNAAAQLLKSNKDALAACRDAAAKTKKEQHCTLIVPAP